MDAGLKNEVTNCIKAVLETFTIQYTKAYILAMVRMIKLENQKKPDRYVLTPRPPWEDNYKTGYLTKEGGIRKNWKKRYFVVRPNWSVDYYESDVESQKPKGKKKGTINLCGYSVVEDPNQGIVLRLKRLAEKMGADLSGLPKPKEYPPMVFELYHPRRRCYYIQAQNKQEFDEWVAEFKRACWRAYGLTVDEWCHQQAFPVAVRKTRWELGRWGWYCGYGSEEQILSDMISDELEYDIMVRVYGKLSGPWMVRSMLRSSIVKAIDAMVSAAVKPAWAAMSKTVKELRPKLEPKIRELTEPIFKAEAQIVEKMKNAVMSVIDPILQEHVCPHLSKVVNILKSPLAEAFDECIRIYQEKIDKWEPKDDLKRSFSDLDWFPRSYWELRTATDKTDAMYEPLWALNLIFKDIYPWSHIWEAHDRLRHVTDNAVYTWETMLLKAAEKGEGADKKFADKAKRDVVDKFKHDAEVATTLYFCDVMKKIVMPPFEALLHPASKEIINPLAEAIPEPLREFIDIKQMFEDLYHSIVDAAIETVVGSDRVAPAITPKEEESSSSSSSSEQEEEEEDVPLVVSKPTETPKACRIEVQHSKHLIDIDGEVKPGAGVVLNPTSSHRWICTSDGFIALASDPNLVLDIEGGAGAGTRIIIWNKKDSDNGNQKWKHEEDGFIHSQGNGCVLDAKGGSAEPGTELLVWDKKETDNTNQKFVLLFD